MTNKGINTMNEVQIDNAGNKSFVANVTLEGVTREVKFEHKGWVSPEYHAVDTQFAAQIGNGKKLHATLFASAKPVNANSKGKNVFVLSTGETFAFIVSTSVRNRAATIVAFADAYADSDIATKQNYYGSLKAGN